MSMKSSTGRPVCHSVTVYAKLSFSNLKQKLFYTIGCNNIHFFVNGSVQFGSEILYTLK